MSCRRSPLHTSMNHAPAVGNYSIARLFLGIEDADQRACSSDKSVMVLSRRSTNFLICLITQLLNYSIA
ncbi:hypothetical protein [Ignatzschineria cameli]|uniref:hypothetical protein n=1 Tax=Ignatzschineria cameli TaxID=2182793 RepID=UPI0010581846|nr:hypothetical protein [Ignatzschineria cameli]